MANLLLKDLADPFARMASLVDFFRLTHYAHTLYIRQMALIPGSTQPRQAVVTLWGIRVAMTVWFITAFVRSRHSLHYDEKPFLLILSKPLAASGMVVLGWKLHIW